jgi:hypothetical protein
VAVGGPAPTGWPPRCSVNDPSLAAAHFNGSDYDPDCDDDRLRGQQLRIWNLMKDGRWATLRQIAAATGDPEASISAQLRHLRKPRFGSHLVNKRNLGRGLFEYQVLSVDDIV